MLCTSDGTTSLVSKGIRVISDYASWRNGETHLDGGDVGEHEGRIAATELMEQCDIFRDHAEAIQLHLFLILSSTFPRFDRE